MGNGSSIASAKDDKPVSVRPFDAITFSLDDLWPRGACGSGLYDRSRARIPNQGTVGREPPSSSGERRANRPDVRARRPVRHYSRSDSPNQSPRDFGMAISF